MVEDHGHGASVGHLRVEARDLSLHQVHEGFTLCAHTTPTGQHRQSTAPKKTSSTDTFIERSSILSLSFASVEHHSYAVLQGVAG